MNRLSTGDKGKGYLGDGEVTRRLFAITPEESVRLALIGDIYAAGTGFTGADLRQEAFIAALERREWREDLSLIQFLTGVMKSLAYSKRKSEKVHVLDRALATSDEGHEEMEFVPAADDGQPEQRAMADEEEGRLFASLERVFKGDDEVQLLIERRLAGDGPAEVKAALGMNQTEYETVCRRLLRGFRKHIKRT